MLPMKITSNKQTHDTTPGPQLTSTHLNKNKININRIHILKHNALQPNTLDKKHNIEKKNH